MKTSILFLGAWFLITLTTAAQLIVKPVAHSSAVSNSTAFNQRALLSVDSVLDTLNLPFWDDFSFSKQAPDTALWHEGNDIYINASLGLNPPTLNVATFDGADANGFPYQTSSNNPNTTDILVSQAIDLSGLEDLDQVALSFYWQAGGNSDRPESIDRLELQFFNAQEQWDSIWSVNGSEANINADFQLANIRIDAQEYLHGGFRFRFEATGSTSGAYDAWHLDYIYLNRDRSGDPESLDDHAISQFPSSIFKAYTMIPRSQLFAFGDSIFNDVHFTLSSFESSVHTVDYTYNLVQTDSPGVNDDSRQVLFSNTPTSFIPLVGINDQETYTVSGINTSHFNSSDNAIYLFSEVVFRTNDGLFNLTDNTQDGVTFLDSIPYNYRINDTARYFFEIDEILAYDDGTAELSAGLDRRGGQLAVRYDLASADELSHIDIYFPRINALPFNRRFRLSVYTDLSDTVPEISQEFARVDSVHSVDRFHRHPLIRPIELDGTFYIVFEQFGNDYFPIGLDVNNPNEDKIFVNLDDEWLSALDDNLSVNGSLMIRPVFSVPDPAVTKTRNEHINEISVYPNPTSGQMRIQGSFDSYHLIDLSGKLLLEGTEQKLDLTTIRNGIYLLRINNKDKITLKRIAVQH